MTTEQLILSRRSVRKFTDAPVTDEQITRLINAAAAAPSGCNSQCWRFAAVKTPEKIALLAKAAEKGVRRFYADAEDDFLASRVKNTVFFAKAPLVILIYQEDMKYHDPRVEKYYNDHGFSHDDMLRDMRRPEILSIGAAVENLLLCAEEMGLGACPMVDPTVAEQEINEALGLSGKLMCVIPVGTSAYTPREKAMKPLDEILTII